MSMLLSGVIRTVVCHSYSRSGFPHPLAKRSRSLSRVQEGLIGYESLKDETFCAMLPSRANSGTLATRE
jgi:hypothetical protein